MKKWILGLLAIGACFCAPHLEATPPVGMFQPSASETVTATLIHKERTIQPGKPFWVAIDVQLEDDWHAYWKNPGDAGMPLSVVWHLPEGYKAGEVHWPYPQKFCHESAIGYGYKKNVTLLVEIIPSETLATGEMVDLKAEVRWVVCNSNTCLPGRSEAVASLPVRSYPPREHPSHAAAFMRAREKIPQHHANAEAQLKGELIALQLTGKEETHAHATRVYFCPEKSGITDPKIGAVLSEAGHIILKGGDALEGTETPSLKGVLVFEQEGKGVIDVVAIHTPIQGKRPSDIAAADVIITDTHTHQAEEVGFFAALLLAFAGGIILNLMPCVLPVISFKILSFVKMSGQKRSLIFKHGLAFSFGVLLSFWLLAGLMIGLQAYGTAVGWGFQLQEPIFVAVLATVIFVFGLSLFGVFEVGMDFASWAGQKQMNSAKSEGLTASFFSGILATAVATPCTGPFLGTAIGVAVGLPPFQAMLIFTALGLGMSSPYLLIAAFPELMRFLPKPGNWMVTFKEAMGFVMLATVLWLIWVFGAQTNTYAMVALLLAFFVFSIGCWIYGKWSTPVKTKTVRLVAIACTLGFFVLGGYTLVWSSKLGTMFNDQELVAHAHDDNSWEKFSPERVEELRAEGTPIFIDFTAKWCLICQANHLVMMDSGVQAKLEELGVVRMKADWTKNDPVITEALRKFQRNGVPLYLLYGTESHQPPKILPQVLTPSVVLEYLEEVQGQIAYKK